MQNESSTQVEIIMVLYLEEIIIMPYIIEITNENYFSVKTIFLLKLFFQHGSS